MPFSEPYFVQIGHCQLCGPTIPRPVLRIVQPHERGMAILRRELVIAALKGCSAAYRHESP